MSQTTQTEVIIIGAGPTGLSLACQLVRYGINFIIIDKSAGVTSYSKALGVHARTLEIYDQLGIASQAVEQGTIAGKVRLLAGSKVRGEMDLSTLGQGLSQYPYMLVLEQSRNERLLYDYLQVHGEDVLWQTELGSFSQSADHVTVNVENAAGQSTSIEAKYLVGCDGPKSPVRHSLGLEFTGSTFERLFYVADVQIDWQFSHDALHVCLAKNSGMAFFPMPGANRYRIVGAFPEGVAKDEGETHFNEIEQEIRAQSGIELQISRVNWFSTYKVHTRHVEKFSKQRCFLAGDSAHIHTPAGGQGMNTGIQDAYNLAWKLAFVLRGRANPSILDSYNAERLPNAEHLLRTTDRMFNLVSGSGWLLSFMRTRVIPPLAKYIVNLRVVRNRFFPLISQIGISYRHSILSRHDADKNFTVKAGDRMPYFMVDGINVYDYLHATKFHLLHFSNTPVDDSIKDGMLKEYSDMLDYRALPLHSMVTRAFGTKQAFMVLLRPDNYIGFISAEVLAEQVESYLNEVIGVHGPHPAQQAKGE
ncbi:MAG TPA: FAD-dependent monooxygenase [Methylophilaceae bacterium]|jgi:2-polyprenyl-6-methoxyphenol hydroxylase-like FAD-dependent oxidoreductase